MTERKRLSQAARMGLNIGPLAVFVAVLLVEGIYVATAAFMALIAAAVAIEIFFERRVSPMLGITAAIVLLLGGLTIYLHNDTFIKIKPTVAYAIFAAVLAGGLATRQNFFKILFDSAFHLSDEHWRTLTVRWIVFFAAMAVMNEIVWRNFSGETWAEYKLFVALPLSFVFALAQTPFILRHHRDDQKDAA